MFNERINLLTAVISGILLRGREADKLNGQGYSNSSDGEGNFLNRNHKCADFVYIYPHFLKCVFDV